MLFLSNDIEDSIPEPVIKGGTEETNFANSFIIGKVNDKLPEIIPALTKNCSIHYVTAGLWSTHDLIFHLLSIIGPAKLTLATWSMTEAPAQMLMKGLDIGAITELDALFDVRIRVRNPQTFEFIKFNIGEHCRISSCHAKVSVLQNQNWSVSVVGSANYTNNPRIEAGVICTDSAIAEFHANWIRREIDNAKPFK